MTFLSLNNANPRHLRHVYRSSVRSSMRSSMRTPGSAMSSSGFTLFEVLVAMGLAVVLMTLIGMSLQYYAVQLNERDSDARRAQLARSVLRVIAEDLEASVYTVKFDASSLAEVLSSAASGAQAGGGGGGGGSSSGSSSSTEEDSSAVSGEEATVVDDLTLSPAVTHRPGMIGNQYQIQFDISRLPRLEEYVPILKDPTQIAIQDMASDLKSVTYYVQQAGLTGVGDDIEQLENAAAANFQARGGLVRRALSRELTNYQIETGAGTNLVQTGDLLAPEVAAIEFAYFDGSQWVYNWNSDEYEALPLAVQIRLTFHPQGKTAADSDESVGSGIATEQPAGDVYDLIVRLPMARPIATDEETSTTSTGTSEDGS